MLYIIVPPQIQVAGAVEVLRLESSRGCLQAGSSAGFSESAVGLSGRWMSQDNSVKIGRSRSCFDVFTYLLFMMPHLLLLLLLLLRLQKHMNNAEHQRFVTVV